MSEFPSHGQMEWIGFKDDCPVFKCPVCGRTIAMDTERRPLPYWVIERGNDWAGHKVSTTLDMYKAGIEQEIIPQHPNNDKIIELWEQDGGGPVFTVGADEIVPD